MVSWTEFLFREDEMVLEVKTGDSCTATVMNLMSLNCAPKNAVCVLPPIFKSCRDSKGLSRNTAFLRRYPPPSPGIHYLQPVNNGVSQSLCANHIAVLWESFQQAVRGSVSTRAMLRAPPLCRCHLPISLPSLNPPPLFHSLRLFKHDAKYILKSWIH